MADTRKLYALIFAKGQTGPTERTVTLPGGAGKPFSMWQTDETAPDFPYAELLLDDEAHANMAAGLEGSGLELIHIEAPKSDKSDSPMHSPQAPASDTATEPPAVPPAAPPKAKARKGRE